MEAISTRREELLLEEAREFALHCDAEVALVIFTADGKRHEFASSSTEEIVARYKESGKIQASESNPEGTGEHVPKDIDALKLRARTLLGRDIAEMSYRDVHLLELQLESGVYYMKDRVGKLLKEEISYEDSRTR